MLMTFNQQDSFCKARKIHKTHTHWYYLWDVIILSINRPFFLSLLTHFPTEFVINRSFFITNLFKRYAYTGFGEITTKKLCKMYARTTYSSFNTQTLCSPCIHSIDILKDIFLKSMLCFHLLIA